MRIKRAAMWATVLMVVAAVSGSAWSQVSPFTTVEFDDDGRVMVTVDGDRVELVSIGGVAARDLVAGSKRAFGDLWQKRIGEDLLDVFEAMEVDLKRLDVIDLHVRRGGEVIVIDGAPMTWANREQVWQHNDAAQKQSELAEDADVLQMLVQTIREQHAYATLRDTDFAAVVEAERQRSGDRPGLVDIRLAMQRIVAATGDGHASVRDWDDAFPRGWLPILLVGAGDRVVAIENDRSAIVDSDHPFVVAIDGMPLERWIDAASAYVAAGSPQLVRERSLRLIRYVNFVRGELGLPPASEVRLTLRSPAGGEIEIDRRVTPIRGLYGAWPWATSRMIERDGTAIGYFRLPRMSPEFDRLPVDVWRRQLREQLLLVTRHADALVIDVRGNGGGRRDPILALMPALMDAGSDPIVVNIAKARIDAFDDPADPRGFLSNRYLYPAGWGGWSDAEREAIAEFRRGFTPAWNVPDADFSDWHYMVVSPGGDEVRRFDSPVVVLMDDTCFSATDIFLAALGELSSVTLVGTASAGGSARSGGHEIGPIGVRLASMASYQPNGQLYDGVGVQPDVIVERQPADLVIDGTDAQLDAAIDLLREHNNRGR